MDPLIARLSPASLSKYLNPERTLARHVRYMSDRIRDAIVRGRGRLIVMMPPGHAKSDTISVHTPLWLLEVRPESKIALISYGHEKAVEWGRAIRALVTEHQDELLTRLAPDSKAAHRWHTEEGGGVYCTGIGGALTGFRANVLIVDDPVKDRQEANSETYRDRAWAWFNEVAMTRLYPDGTAIIVLTRWHEDDLAGRILRRMEEAPGADRWEVIRFPYLAEEDDVLGRHPGEALWPEAGYTVEYLESLLMDSYTRAALYQQRPSPAGGSVFRREHFRYMRPEGSEFVLLRPDMEPRRFPRSACWIAQTCDTAIKAKTASDWTVCLTAAVTPENDVLVLDVARARLEVPDLMGFLMSRRAAYNPRWQGVEDKSSGSGLIQEAARMGRPFRILKADADKITRSAPAATLYENGKIYHQQGASWLAEFEGELLSFPNGQHDDQVDALAYMAREVARPMPCIALI